MLFVVALLFTSVFLLIFISDLIVDILTKVSQDFNISLLIISIVIVGFGSSLPEFIVSLTLVEKGEVFLSVGNIIGSNTFNTLIVVGVAALIYPISKYRIKNINAYFMLFASVALSLAIFYGRFSLIIGVLMLSAIACYLFTLIAQNTKHNATEKPSFKHESKLKTGLKFLLFSTIFLTFTYFSLKFSSVFLSITQATTEGIAEVFKYHKTLPNILVLCIHTSIIALLAFFCNRFIKLKQGTSFYLFSSAFLMALLFLALIYSSELVYLSSTKLAHIFKIPEKIISILILAVGTSIPELSFAIVASFKRQSEVIIGNVLGSNIFNIFFVFGFLNIFEQGIVQKSLALDSLIVLISALLLVFIVIKHKVITRAMGFGFASLYVLYLTFFVL